MRLARQRTATGGPAQRKALVLHVVPEDLARGAQVHARELRQRLDGPEVEHQLVVLFGREGTVTDADKVLGAPSGIGRRLGLSLSAYVRLAWFVRTLRPDLLIAHGGEPFKYVGLLPMRLLRVYHRIGGRTVGSSAASLPVYRLLARRYGLLIGVGQAVTRQAVEDFRFSPEHAIVIHNGRDPNEFRPARRPHEGNVRLLFVGHVYEGKRPDIFAEMADRLGPDVVTATVVGDGPLVDELAVRHPNVHFAGRRSDIAAVMGAHDVFVFTSELDEGLPGVLVEAALVGLPIVSTRVPGADEVIEDGVTGLLVPTGDVGKLAEAVSALIADPVGRARMGAAARQRALRLFDISDSGRAWAAALDGMLSHR